ncbi:alpha/beta hydrolase [Sedimenticola selenatireducens]|uniref:alpha/beta hydrolase n=1 Tax=Sedimenticola selenatireducens TaxID=191960 RepID=UPI00048DEA73|nr:alpha/beta fold hydrolase [Sedimenticola selenatireducens]
MTRYILLLAALFLAPAQADEVSLSDAGLTLNARLEKTENWPAGPVILITHGTLSHNRSEIITALQTLFQENGLSSLAINLGLGLNDRQGPYECPTPHAHKHADAVTEIGLWLAWLKRQGAQQVVLLGHSRGGNQTAWFAAEQSDPVIRKVILVAPQTWSPEYAAEEYEKRYGKPLAPVLASAQALVSAGKPNTSMERTDFIYCRDTSVTAGAFVSYYAPEPRQDTPHLLPGISQPVLVFAGTEDQVVKGLDKALAPMAEAGAITLEVLEGADHSFRDLYAEDLVERAIEFINE